MKKLVAILISGRGSNMQALLRAMTDANAPYPITRAECVLVLANRADAGGLQSAQEFAVPTMVLPSAGLVREEYDAKLHEVLIARRIDIVCLAGFMRILSKDLVEKWAGRMINIHPSLLPAYRGLDTHARALADGATEHGCTVHFVTPGLDEGPIILQARCPVQPDDTPDSLAARVLELEHRLYPQALEIVCRDNVLNKITGQKFSP